MNRDEFKRFLARHRERPKAHEQIETELFQAVLEREALWRAAPEGDAGDDARRGLSDALVLAVVGVAVK